MKEQVEKVPYKNGTLYKLNNRRIFVQDLDGDTSIYFTKLVKMSDSKGDFNKDNTRKGRDSNYGIWENRIRLSDAALECIMDFQFNKQGLTFFKE